MAGFAIVVVITGMVEFIVSPILDAQVTEGAFSRPVSIIGMARATGAVQSLVHESPTDGGVTL